MGGFRHNCRRRFLLRGSVLFGGVRDGEVIEEERSEIGEFVDAVFVAVGGICTESVE